MDNSQNINILKGEIVRLNHPRIGLIGWFPPPMGGVSIHIKRLKRELDFRGIDLVIYDLGASEQKRPGVIPVSNFPLWVLSRLFSPKFDRDIIHVHTLSWKQRALALVLKMRSAKIIYTFHSLREEENNLGLISRICMKLVIQYGDYFIAVAPHILEKLMKWGVDKNKSSVISAYIPPKIDQKDWDQIPEKVKQFIDDHSPVITANASRIGFHNGSDLYGIDLCVSLTKELVKDFTNVGFIFCLPEIGANQYLATLEKQIVENSLTENFLFLRYQNEFYPILALSDVFVRPTNSDGDALSIREAISLNIPVVCSDVVGRPEGVTLFRNRDFEDFCKQVRQKIKDNYLVLNTPPKNILIREIESSKTADIIRQIYLDQTQKSKHNRLI